MPNPFTFKLSQVDPTPLAGGSIKVVDTRSFPAAQNIVGSVVTVEPGAIRSVLSAKVLFVPCFIAVLTVIFDRELHVRLSEDHYYSDVDASIYSGIPPSRNGVIICSSSSFLKSVVPTIIMTVCLQAGRSSHDHLRRAIQRENL